MVDAPKPPAGNPAAVLKHKVGPLPVAGWLAVVGVGVGVGLYLRRRNAANEPVATDTLDPSTVATPPEATVGGGAGGGGYNPTPAGAANPAPPATNDEWSQRVISILVAQGYEPVSVDTAIRQYLAGQPRTAQQDAVVNAAIRALGPPPVAPPLPVGNDFPTIDEPAPTPTPANPYPTNPPVPNPPVDSRPVIVPNAPDDGALSLGSSGPRVVALQSALEAHGYHIYGDAQGIFGYSTQNAVTVFQRVNGLGESGVVDGPTANLLGLNGAAPAPAAPAQAPGNLSNGNLRQGSTGARVVQLQQSLEAHGYHIYGDTAGVFGASTDNAVRVFQQVNGLQVDGVVGTQTAAALGL